MDPKLQYSGRLGRQAGWVGRLAGQAGRTQHRPTVTRRQPDGNSTAGWTRTGGPVRQPRLAQQAQKKVSQNPMSQGEVWGTIMKKAGHLKTEAPPPK